MICQRCLSRGLRSSVLAKKRITRQIATTSNHQKPAAATSTSAAQPFSTPMQPSPASASGIPKSASELKAGPGKSHKEEQTRHKAPPAVMSSVPAGTPLKGLNYFKGKEDPVAMEDHEYPPWLWTVLQPKLSDSQSPTKGESTPESDPRIYSKSAKARQMANKRLRAKQAANPEMMVPKTPVYEETVDLKPELEDRMGLNRALRGKRRGDIKNANFLRGMR